MADTWAFIPARGGSKGIPGKNLREVGGKSLVRIAIECAREAGLHEVLVLTDSTDIQAEAVRYGAICPRLRPPEISTDDAHMFLTYKFGAQLLHDLDSDARAFVALLPTTPLRSVKTVIQCVDLLAEGSFDWVFSTNEMEHHPFRAMKTISETELEPFFPLEAATLWSNRQELPPAQRFNGGVIGGLIKHLHSHTEYNVDGLGTFDTRLGFVETSQAEALDVDSELDLKFVEFYLSEEKSH